MHMVKGDNLLIKPLLGGGSIQIGMLNASGAPYGLHNMKKTTKFNDFRGRNDINITLETGCTQGNLTDNEYFYKNV